MTEVRAGTAADIDSIADALTRAFDDDPVMSFIFPNGQTKKMRALFVGESKRAMKKGALHTTTGGPAQGAAIWMAPGNWRTGGLELLTQLPLMFTMGRDTPRALSLLSKMEKVHPKQPHWYLAVLGTDPAHQGKGVGSALIGKVLERCDEAGDPAYLESSKESNIPFYRRHGFEVTGEVQAKGGPTLWPMWREPRPPGH
jgi:ribosomal protein S18 acetylase RimI-like enzyme